MEHTGDYRTFSSMSWLAKVSHIAGRAEDLLNQIDQNAAVALRNTKKGVSKTDSVMSLIDIKGQGTNKLEKLRPETVEATTKKHVRTDHTSSVSSRIHNKKKDDELIAYLNNSNEPTSSRCSSVASCFSAPNPQVANAFGTMSEPYTTEEYLKAQHSDALKCLSIKESQMAVTCVRLQEAEEAIMKKDIQIAELDKELKLMKRKLEAEDDGIANDRSSLKKLQREHNREKEEFEKREQDYVKRLESANNENSETEKELQRLRAKILEMEMNEQNLVEEIRLAKYNLKANKHEFDEYKQRAQKILSAKENLLTSLKENSSGSDGVANSVELEELRCEFDLLKDDLQQSQFVIYNLKGDIQELENRLHDEQRVSGVQRENLLKQIHHHLSQTNQYKEQMERIQLEYDLLKAEMHRQEEAVERKLAEKDIELTKLMEEKKASKRYEIGEMEQKILFLSEKLISKQAVIERIESEKRSLELRLERAEHTCKNTETSSIKTVAIEMRGNGVNTNDQSYSLFTVSHSDNMFIRTAKFAFYIFDHVGLRLAIFMRNPMFRFIFFMYCILLHAWIKLFITEITYSHLESMASVTQIPQSLRSIAHYVKIGAENADRDPIVHYWCLFYAVQTGMNIDKKSAEALQYLTSLLSILEDMKKKLSGQEALTQDLVAQAHIENFAMKLFDYADKNDRQSNFTKGVVRAFYTAGHLIDVLTLFGELDENLIAIRKYAKWKATYIHSCMKNGEIPKPGSGFNQDDNLKDFNMRIPQTEMRKESQSTTDGPTQPPPNSLGPSYIYSDSAPTVETCEASHIPEAKRSSQEVSENSDSGRLTLDDYMEAQKYAKYAEKRAKTKREDYSPLETKERSKKVIMFGRKSKSKIKNKKEQHTKGEVLVVSPFTGEHAIFAVPLSLAVLRMGSHDGIPLPVIVRQCIDCINEKGLCVEGIHRISAPKANLDKLEKAVNSRYSIQLEDIHDASGLLKRFLRQLPEHILTNEKRPIFEKIAANCPCGTLSPCRCLVADMLKAQLISLPGENYMLLAYIFIHSQMILQNSDKNKMGMAALGLILQAALNVSQPLVRIFLLNASDIILMKYHSPSVSISFGRNCIF
uniref:Golgin-84 n=1 Tax=Onchocerca volvulus TaxID=6282 RepID=A0A8R1TXG2_ONCVO